MFHDKPVQDADRHWRFACLNADTGEAISLGFCADHPHREGAPDEGYHTDGHFSPLEASQCYLRWLALHAQITHVEYDIAFLPPAYRPACAHDGCDALPERHVMLKNLAHSPDDFYLEFCPAHAHGEAIIAAICEWEHVFQRWH
jgi:hypothetical protein